jgi:putative solute:sodium symporter small subunit
MIDRKERKPYWLHTKWQAAASLVPLLFVVIILPLNANALNVHKFLGFPLGFFLAAHGLFFIAVVMVASFVNRQDMIDHWHGAHEDN